MPDLLRGWISHIPEAPTPPRGLGRRGPEGSRPAVRFSHYPIRKIYGLPLLFFRIMETRKKQISTIDEYISTFPKQIQDILQRLRQTIKESAPQAQEAISYRIPTFKLNGNLVHFAAFKNHIGFFPTSSGVVAFQKELSGYETSKGTIRFPLDKPIPFDLIRKIVQFRVNENLKRREEM
jgi:uncharacterized protein YdhG (YjbR/CyaY superfamily)